MKNNDNMVKIPNIFASTNTVDEYGGLCTKRSILRKLPGLHFVDRNNYGIDNFQIYPWTSPLSELARPCGAVRKVDQQFGGGFDDKTCKIDDNLNGPGQTTPSREIRARRKKEARDCSTHLARYNYRPPMSVSE